MTFIKLLNREENPDDENQGLMLRVVRDSGINVTPGFEVSVTDLNVSEEIKYKQFINNNDTGISFKIDIIILKTDIYNNMLVTDYLLDLINNMQQVYLQTDAIDIPNGVYIITRNSSRKQERDNSTIWNLEFTTYTPLNLVKFNNDNSAVQKAIKKNKSTKQAATIYQKLKKCDYKLLKYSKNKKIVNCVKILQQVLYKKGHLKKKYITGWFGKHTTESVKNFQKKYNKKYSVAQTTTNGIISVSAGKLLSGQKSKTKVNNNVKIRKQLKVTGKVDKDTWQALYNNW